MKKGKLIVIEGTDCSGKETQTKKIVEKLKSEGINLKTMSFPCYETPTGKIIEGPYLGKSSPCLFPKGPNAVAPEIACLYYAADRFAKKSELIKSLENNTNWILDRYVEANMGHQGGKAKNSQERQKIINFIENLEYNLLELPKPDKVIFLYMPYKVGMELNKKRGGKKDGHETNPEHLKNAEKTYLEIATQKKWDIINCAPNGSIRSIEDIHKEIYEKISKELQTTLKP